jgi:hypothetical protein
MGGRHPKQTLRAAPLRRHGHSYLAPCWAKKTTHWCLKTGVPYIFQRGKEVITILGVGRIGRPASSKKAKPHYIQPDEQHRLELLGDTQVDILLTHDAPCDRVYPGSGSLEIEQALLRHQPRYHFLGTMAAPPTIDWNPMA